MIDTDKYEGHTLAPWFPPDFGGEGLLDNKGRVMALLVYDEEEPQTSDEWLANARLIADAPLLLAEVKRLQDALKEAVEVVKEMEGMAYAGADADKFANHALEFIGNVKELIE